MDKLYPSLVVVRIFLMEGIAPCADRQRNSAPLATKNKIQNKTNQGKQKQNKRLKAAVLASTKKIHDAAKSNPAVNNVKLYRTVLGLIVEFSLHILSDIWLLPHARMALPVVEDCTGCTRCTGHGCCSQ